MIKISKVICFLCEDIKLVQNTDWKSCIAHGKEHGVIVKDFEISSLEIKQGLSLKLPDGNVWAVVGS
ncbi:MAG: hypothetical protein CL705_04400 [Chloroflexi bacterium]|nr:hypothetical protein [Chloroflexota bacterium]|tara:strand:+ start:165 stop:365 length:201 start_codon:yes stop_codon:yes gene_type:complete